MSTFDLKSFMINEGLTRVSRDRKKLLRETSLRRREYPSCKELVDLAKYLNTKYSKDVTGGLSFPSRNSKSESIWFLLRTTYGLELEPEDVQRIEQTLDKGALSKPSYEFKTNWSRRLNIGSVWTLEIKGTATGDWNDFDIVHKSNYILNKMEEDSNVGKEGRFPNLDEDVYNDVMKAINDIISKAGLENQNSLEIRLKGGRKAYRLGVEQGLEDPITIRFGGSETPLRREIEEGPYLVDDILDDLQKEKDWEVKIAGQPTWVPVKL